MTARTYTFKVTVVPHSDNLGAVEYNMQGYTRQQIDLAVAHAMADYYARGKLHYNDVQSVYYTNTRGNSCWIKDIYKWANGHDYGYLNDDPLVKFIKNGTRQMAECRT